MLLAVSATSVFLFNVVFAAPTEPVPSIELTSQHVNFANEEAGSWKVNKMAGWTARDKARVIIDVDTTLHYMDKKTDILLVIDHSSSQDGEDKAESYRQALTYFTNKILDEDDDRRIALVTFDYDYHIKTDFTNDRELLLSEVANFSFMNNGNNYYQALNGAEMVLRNYVKQPDRDVILLFLTDGAPDEEAYYQRAEYQLIKHGYPYITVNAVQYEMGEVVSKSLASISDNQFSANKGTLKDVLFDASVIPYYYDDFVITDYIDERYFTLADTESVLVNKGSYRIEEDGDTPKIVWDLSGILRSGAHASMEINLDLKPEYHAEPILFPTNRRAAVISSIPELQDESVTTESTPVLKADYKVKVITNTPEGCDLSDTPTERIQYIFDIVEIANNTPVCPGYRFAGYKSESRLKKVNDDYFIMPSNDVTFVATWAKLSIGKSMDGTVHIIKTLYGEIDKKARKEDGTYNLDSSINFNTSYSYYYANGTYTVTSTAEDEYPRHYFRGAVYDNNVIFAGLCWKAALTTSTGGVKLIYNGEKDENDQCGNLRASHDGYNDVSQDYLGSNYYYGTDYTYDESAGTFSLAGVITLTRMNTSTADSLIGQYTCKSTNPNAACSTLYLIEDKYATNDTMAYTIKVKPDIPYFAIGKVPFHRQSNSLAYGGYMYGDSYTNENFNYTGSVSTSRNTIISNTSISADFWYADDITYNENGDGRYHLVNPYQVNSSADFSSLAGKYTFRNTSSSYSDNSVYYIAQTSSSMMYYLHLREGQSLENVNVKYNISSEVIDHGDGTYTMVEPTVVKTSEWPLYYRDFYHKFICDYDSDNSCSQLFFITGTYINYYDYVGDNQLTIAKTRDGYNLQDYITVRRYQLSQDPSAYTEYEYSCGNTDTVCAPENLIRIVSYTNTGYSYHKNILLSEDAVWDGTQYILSGQTTIENLNNFDIISTHHYFCAEPGKTVCDSVKYIVVTHSYSNTPRIDLDAMTLTGGITPAQTVEAMLSNKYNSTTKYAVDTWYERNLTDYTSLIEDTVYCNDRTVRYLAGWEPHGGNTKADFLFESYYRAYFGGGEYSVNLGCSTKDSFTVSNLIGNGKLTYPVGILSVDEVNLIGAGNLGAGGVDHYLHIDDDYYIAMSPRSYSYGMAYTYIYGSGFGMGYVKTNAYVRPVISVMPGIIVTTGDGTAENPWILE